MGGNDMDAFKELATRSPDMELMTLEDAHAMVFWSGAAQYWAQRKIDYAKSAEQTPALQAQMAAWIKEGQKAGEFSLKANQHLGKIAAETPKATPPKSSGGRYIGEPCSLRARGLRPRARSL